MNTEKCNDDKNILQVFLVEFDFEEDLSDLKQTLQYAIIKLYSWYTYLHLLWIGNCGFLISPQYFCKMIF